MGFRLILFGNIDELFRLTIVCTFFRFPCRVSISVALFSRNVHEINHGVFAGVIDVVGVFFSRFDICLLDFSDGEVLNAFEAFLVDKGLRVSGKSVIACFISKCNELSTGRLCGCCRAVVSPD